jgi:hypothetical protein
MQTTIRIRVPDVRDGLSVANVIEVTMVGKAAIHPREAR